jgi:hypothetical protein
MTTAANPNAYQSNAWNGPWNSQAWSDPPFWHPAGLSRPAGIAAMVLGFILFWPIGLAILIFMAASGRFGCRGRRWQQNQNQPPGQNGGQWHGATPPWSNWGGGKPKTSGNAAFDEYRADTLRRLEEEQTEFSSFLERLRFAKDKAEFDQFMAEHRQAPRPPANPDEPPHA